MLTPDEVLIVSKENRDENLRFRSYLKNHADNEELDKQFSELHKSLFENYDCSKCRNCCKFLRGEIPSYDIEKDAKHLNMDPQAFIDAYLEQKSNLIYQAKNLPCDFLKDGNCILDDNKPDGCKKYPYTNEPERLFSLYSVLNVIEICPVAYEIYEQLKNIYHFKW